MKLLPELAEKTRSEQGNVSYTIYQSESDPNEFPLHEVYVDTAGAEAHRQSEHYQRIVVQEIIPHLEVRVKGGETLSVGFTKTGDTFADVTLTGPADFVFDGAIAL
jgi:hypothetical protein